MGIHIPPAYQPVVRHTTLKTTFTGLQHTLSINELPIHQYRGIKYASIPARFRQAKLFASYRSSTDATRYGYVCSSQLIYASALSPLQAHLPATKRQNE
jgi:carboxylesterase type B